MSFVPVSSSLAFRSRGLPPPDNSGEAVPGHPRKLGCCWSGAPTSAKRRVRGDDHEPGPPSAAGGAPAEIGRGRPGSAHGPARGDSPAASLRRLRLVVTDPRSWVGSSPLADVPCLPVLPALIRRKYATDVNRWTDPHKTTLLPGARGAQHLDSSDGKRDVETLAVVAHPPRGGRRWMLSRRVSDSAGGDRRSRHHRHLPAHRRPDVDRGLRRRPPSLTRPPAAPEQVSPRPGIRVGHLGRLARRHPVATWVGPGPPRSRAVHLGRHSAVPSPAPAAADPAKTFDRTAT